MERGQWGQGFSGTTIKDTWTKSRGRKEVGLAGVGWRDGEKMQTSVIDNNKNFKKNNKNNYKKKNKYEFCSSSSILDYIM